MSRITDRALEAVGTAFYLGYLPVAPGTFGALLGVGIYAGVVLLLPPGSHTPVLAAATILVSLITVAMGNWAERFWGKHDPGCFVTDEVAGFLCTVTFWRTPDLLLAILWAFTLTRVIDIIKPPPARQLEALPGGWGIMADDICTSLMAVVVLFGITWLFPAVVGMPG